MASRIIMTDFFRASYVHLVEKFAHDPNDEPKYCLAAMFSQHGVAEVPNVGQLTSSFNNIIHALNEVCMEEWGCDFEGAKDFVTYPPEFRDGNKGKPKKENGRPVPGQFETNPAEHDMFVTSLKNGDIQPGTVGPDGKDVDPSVIYSGAWVRAQIEVSAFMAKNGSSIIKIELLNVQYCYDDESLGGRTPVQAASTAFADMAITNTNIKAGTGQTMRPVAPTAPGKPTPPTAPGKPVAPTAPGKPVAPTAPGKPVAPQMQTVKELVALTDYTIDQLRTEFQYSDDQIVAEGFGEWQEKQVPVAAPGKPTPPTKPVAPTKPAAPTVIMNDDSDYTYEQLTGEFGWTDAQIVEGGYGQFNYLDPQA